jgi:hypothetical protein
VVFDFVEECMLITVSIRNSNQQAALQTADEEEEEERKRG